MARKQAKRSEEGNPLLRAAAGVRRLFSRKTHNPSTHGEDVERPIATTDERAGREERLGTPRLSSDIPMERLAAEYIPRQTSLKASFRADGADRERDQDDSRSIADDGWKDEDRFTNRSGDPRIGTHGRTYEPGERLESPTASSEGDEQWHKTRR